MDWLDEINVDDMTIERAKEMLAWLESSDDSECSVPIRIFHVKFKRALKRKIENYVH